MTYRWRSVEILDACMPTRFPATPLITGWNTAMSGYLVTEVHILSNVTKMIIPNLAMTLLRIFPPRLEITMAASTGLQPFLRISLVWALPLAMEAQA